MSGPWRPAGSCSTRATSSLRFGRRPWPPAPPGSGSPSRPCMKGNTLKRSSKPSEKSEAWRARDRKVLWHPFTQQQLWMEEEFPVITGGKGAVLIDADGRRYLDGVSSLWCNTHGHGRREINAAMKKQLDRIAH